MVSKPQYQEMPDHPPGNQAAATDAQRAGATISRGHCQKRRRGATAENT
jgi:hypothetical protein